MARSAEEETLFVWVPTKLKDRLRRAAKEERRQMTGQLVKMLEAALDARDRAAQKVAAE